MRTFVSGTLVASGLAIAASAVLSGSAGAAELHQADNPSIWLVPGADLGQLLAPTVAVPTAVLAPIDGLLSLLHG